MAPVNVGLGVGVDTRTSSPGGGASRYAPYPAPAGYRWEFLTEDGVNITEAGAPLVEIVRIN